MTSSSTAPYALLDVRGLGPRADLDDQRFGTLRGIACTGRVRLHQVVDLRSEVMDLPAWFRRHVVLHSNVRKRQLYSCDLIASIGQRSGVAGKRHGPGTQRTMGR